MEVHHHPHVGVKKIKEYLLEGVMIFLAVSMGFIAENIRENLMKHEKEKILIESFIQNLKVDTATLNSCIQRNLQKNKLQDSLLNLATKDLSDTNNLYSFYYYFIKGTYLSLFIPSDAAMTQIKTDGGLSIISKKGVIDSILNYDKQNKQIERHNGVYTDESENFWKAAYKLMEIRILKDTSYVDFFNGRTVKKKTPPPIINNTQDLKIFFGTLTRILLLTQVNRGYMKTQKETAERLIHFLTETYHLD
jgi:hypothetical protein